jgi:hypothetical protein
VAEGVDIGTLSGRVEFEDHVSKTLDLILGRIDQLDSKFEGLDGTIAETAAGVFTGEAAFKALEHAIGLTVETLKDMTIEGAGMADIVENFEHLTSSAGRLSSTLLGELKTGTHNTIEDLELIKLANKDLTAGMNLTDAQFRTLANGAFALAQATGGSVKDGLDTMNDAMLTGRTRAIALLTGKIDLTKAESDLAAKLGTTADRLTDEGKLLAARTAILGSVSAATQRLGEQTDGLDEKADQAHAAFKNFYDELAMSIGKSPEVSHAFDTIRDSIGLAFGGDKEKAITAITNAVGDFADGVSKYGPPVIDFFSSVAHGLGDIIGASGIGEKFNQWQDSVSQLSLLVQGYSLAEAEAMVNTQREAEILAQKAKEAARAAEAEDKHANAVVASTEAGKREQDVLDKNKLILKETTDELKKRMEAQKEIASATGSWHEILKGLDETMVDTIKHYLEAGVAQDKLATAYGLTAVQIGTIVKVLKEETEAHKLEEKQVIDATERWAQYDALRVSASGTTTDQLIADIASWRAAQIKSHQAAKTDTVDFYTWLNAQSKLSLEVAEQQRLEADGHSKAHFDRVAADAKDAYEFATQHADQFTSAYIEDLRKTKDEATLAATHWRDTIGGALGDFIEQADKLAESMKFSFEVNSDNFEKSLESAAQKYSGATGGKVGQKFSTGGGIALAKQGYSFEEIIEILTSGQLPKGEPKGPRIPGFREGGIGDFGEGTLAMLHGKEAIVPLDRAGSMGVTNHFYVNGTAEEVAEKISNIIMDKAFFGRPVMRSNG